MSRLPLIVSPVMNQQDQPPKIFVSHIHEEAALGKVVKDGLEDSFAERVAVFVSSDRRDNPGGERWLDKIERELKDPQARMLVSLVSPTSVREPWISIELGAAWILGRAVFPLCHSGQEPGALPRPLGDFGGADLGHDDAADRLIGSVERAVGLTIPARWARREFLTEMRQAASQVVAGPARIKGEGKVTPAKPEDPGLPDEQVRILRTLAHSMNGGTNDLKDDQAAQLSSLKPAIFSHHVTQLENRQLVYVSRETYGNYVRITPEGSGWLIEHHQMPE